MKAPPLELRPRVPGTFDLFVKGNWIGTVQYMWDAWFYSYLGRSLSLKGYPSSQAAITALLAFHVTRLSRGDEDERVPRPALAPFPDVPPIST